MIKVGLSHVHGKWALDSNNLLLIHTDSGYEVDLRECLDPYDMMDWMCHLAFKKWCSSVDCSDFLIAICQIFMLMNYPLKKGQVIDKVEERVYGYLNQRPGGFYYGT